MVDIRIGKGMIVASQPTSQWLETVNILKGKQIKKARAMAFVFYTENKQIKMVKPLY